LLDLAEAAIDCGANAVQVYVFNNLYRDKRDQERVNKFRLNPSWLPDLKKHIGYTPLIVAPYHREAEYVIESADIIALDSFNTNHPGIIEYCGGTRKPLHIGTCAVSHEEIEGIIEVVRPGDEAPRDLTLFHHPAGKIAKDMHMRRLLDIGQEYMPLNIGLQVEHNNPYLIAASILYRVEAINVLFDGADGLGIDQNKSFTTITMSILVDLINEFYDAMNCGCSYWPLVDELARANYRRDPSDWLRPLKM
jgi:sialic acid synthase SpsE